MPWGCFEQSSRRASARDQFEKLEPSAGVARTRERQLDLALVLASQSNDEASPRALIAADAQGSTAKAAVGAVLKTANAIVAAAQR
jgi:hypothetical protein